MQEKKTEKKCRKMGKEENKGLFEQVFTPQAVLSELIYGSIAGFSICLSGHPFEYGSLKFWLIFSSTLKVRIQMEQTKLFSTVSSIFKNEGLGGFYKGIASPLSSVPLINAIVFATY